MQVDDRIFNLKEADKAKELNVSVWFLQKDRRRAKPSIPFRRYGRLVRYAPGPEPEPRRGE